MLYLVEQSWGFRSTNFQHIVRSLSLLCLWMHWEHEEKQVAYLQLMFFCIIAQSSILCNAADLSITWHMAEVSGKQPVFRQLHEHQMAINCFILISCKWFVTWVQFSSSCVDMNIKLRKFYVSIVVIEWIILRKMPKPQVGSWKHMLLKDVFKILWILLWILQLEFLFLFWKWNIRNFL